MQGCGWCRVLGRCPRPRPVGRSMLGAAAETAEVEGVVVAALRRDSGRAVPATDAARAAASRLGSAAALRAEVDAHLAGGGAGESTAVTVAAASRWLWSWWWCSSGTRMPRVGIVGYFPDRRRCSAAP